jgi:predicted nucleotidyltransferase
MVHHMQNLRDEHKDWGTGGDLKDDEVLRNLEAEAYEVGNILFRMWTEELKHTKALNESTIREATEDDVDLSSFKVQTELNPKIWVNDLMDSRVRLKLLDIAQDFVEFLDVTWVKPEDTIVVGSIANYNWSRYSDIDLHIVMDYSKVDDRKKFVENYFQSKKKEWNDTHDKISIFGFPVELYVQDKDADNASSAVYSIDKNKWLKKPSRSTFTKKDIDSFTIKKKASKLMTDIENIEDDDKESNDEYKNRKLYDRSSDLIDDITDTRKKSLSATKDEMNTDNLVFKVLRRNGYLDKLFKLRDKTYDKMNSLK